MKSVRSISLLLALALLGSLMAVPAAGADVVLSGNCGDHVTFTLTSGGTLTLSGSGDTWDFDSDFAADGAPHRLTAWKSQGMDSRIRSLVVEEGVTGLGSYLCYWCENLETVRLPESLQRIGYKALAITGLRELRLPRGVREIAPGALSLIWSLRRIDVDPENPVYCSPDGVLYDKNRTTLLCYPIARAADAYVLPATVTAVGKKAMQGAKVSSVILPEGLRTIGDSAFQFSELRTVTLPASLREIGDGAFSLCRSLETVEALGTPAHVGSLSFTNTPWADSRDFALLGTTLVACSLRQQEIRVPEGVEVLAPGALCLTGARRVSLPDSLRVLGKESLPDTLLDLELPQGLTTLESGALSVIWGMDHLVLPASLTSMGDLALPTSGLRYAAFRGTCPDFGAYLPRDTRYVFYPAGDDSYAPLMEAWEGPVFLPWDGTSIPMEAMFSDLPRDRWYYDSCEWAWARGLLTGTGGDRFAPGAEMTRAMLATALWRMAGSPRPRSGYGTVQFDDIPRDAWYLPGVCWAWENHLVNGVGGRRFAGDAPVTRQQAAVMLCRFAALMGLDATGGDAPGDTPAWAAGAVGWAADRGILRGDGGGDLHLSGALTRAQMAAMLRRFRESG